MVSVTVSAVRAVYKLILDVSVIGKFALLGCSRADANVLGKGNQVFTFFMESLSE